MFKVRLLVFCVIFSCGLIQAQEPNKRPLPDDKNKKEYQVDVKSSVQRLATEVVAVSKQKLSQVSDQLSDSLSQSQDKLRQLVTVAVAARQPILLTSSLKLKSIVQEKFAQLKNVTLDTQDKFSQIFAKRFGYQKNPEYFLYPLLLTDGYDVEDEILQDDLLIFKPLHYEKNEVTNERGDRATIHEHSADTPGGRVDFVVGSLYEQHDTIEKCVDVKVEIRYTPNESPDSSSGFQRDESQAEHRSESRQDSSDRSSFDDHIKDAAMSRDSGNSSLQSQHMPDNSSDDYPQKQRSRIYTWCKGKKENLIGLSKKNLAQQKAQEVARLQSQQKEIEVEKQVVKSDNLQQGLPQAPSKKQDLQTSNKASLRAVAQEQSSSKISNGCVPQSYSPPANYSSGYSANPNHSLVNDHRSSVSQNITIGDVISKWEQNAPSYHAQHMAELQQAAAYAYHKKKQEQKAREEEERSNWFAYYEEIAENKLLEKEGYEFHLSEEEIEIRLKEYQIEIGIKMEDYNDIELKKRVEENCVNSVIRGLYGTWRRKSLGEIREKERIKYNEKIKREAELLIAYGYKFQLSDKLNRELQETQAELKNCTISWFERWFTSKFERYQILKRKIKELETRACDEKYSSKVQALAEIEIKEQLKAEKIAQEKADVQAKKDAQINMASKFNDMHGAVLEDLTEQFETSKKVEKLKLDAAQEKIVKSIDSGKGIVAQAESIEQEEALGIVRESIESEIEQELIEKKALKIACSNIKEIITAAIAHGDKSWLAVNMPTECDACDKEQVHKDKKALEDSDDFMSRQLIEAQYEWKQAHHVDQANPQEKLMIYKMLDAIALEQNDKTIELAQAGLQAWAKAQGGQSDEEYDFYKKRSQSYYQALHNETSDQSLTQQAGPVQKDHVEKLLQKYTTVLDYDREQKASGQQREDAHIARIEKRAASLRESKEQLDAHTLTHRTYEMSSQARGYMMANNMNYAAFDGAPVTNFQHCLTQEILGIIESSVSMTQGTTYGSVINQLAQHNCNLAVSAQQLNQSSRIEEAVAITDLSHFFEMYGKLLVDSGLQSQTTVDFNLGVLEGSARAVQKWGEFGAKLCCHPNQTLGELAQDCKAVGQGMFNIVKAISQASPHAYLDDTMQDMRDRLDQLQQGQAFDAQGKSRSQQRTERNLQSIQDGLSGALQAAKTVIESMMQKSTREIGACVSETVVDSIITGKVTDALLHLSTMIGNQVLQVADKINKNVPPHLLDSKVNFATTTTGELIAIADTTGENIGVAMATQAATNRADQIIKNAAKAKELAERVNEFVAKNKEEAVAKINELEKAEYNKKLAEVTAATEIKSVDRLKEISKDIPQVEEFRKYTNDFKNLEKLNPEEVMYLNLCDWLDPQAKAINKRLKDCGGLKFIDPKTGAEVVVEKFDLIHSLIGEMKPQAFANRTSGGHLLIEELRAATLDFGEIKSFGNGFFDMEIKYAGKVSGKYKPNSYFPVGTSVEQAVEMVENAILNAKEITIVINPKNASQQACRITSKFGHEFMLRVEGKVAKFHPWNA